MRYFSQDFIDFFEWLAGNNTREWFYEHKPLYETAIKQPFQTLIMDVLARMSDHDHLLEWLRAQDCIYRINRDIRFSTDKTPYKTHVGAIIAPWWRKDFVYPGLYVEIGWNGIVLASGSYMPDKEQITVIRDAIVWQLKRFNAIISEETLVTHWGSMQGAVHKRLAPAYKAVYEQQPLIAHKQFYYTAHLAHKHILRDDLDELLLEYYEAILPFRDFLRHALSLFRL